MAEETSEQDEDDTHETTYALWLPWARETESWILRIILEKTWKLSSGATAAVKDVLKERGEV